MNFETIVILNSSYFSNTFLLVLFPKKKLLNCVRMVKDPKFVEKLITSSI
jgi:hypothetical protein